MRTLYRRGALGCVVASIATAAPLSYPPTPEASVVDVYHGVAVADPFRWLEELESPAVRAWVAAQNALAQPYLERLPQRAWLRQRLEALWRYERFGVPVERGGRYFYLRND
ncbi:MAG: S9 family peptidase, partial [Gammaproteobacteria bacterium]|nr:S9 family peptidase [Gammaproteobacteria bacterium]